MSTGLNDNEIISKVLNGDQQAYAGLVNRYKNYVFTLALTVYQKPGRCRRSVAGYIYQSISYLADFRGDSKFSTWLYTIVNTTCITFLRKKKLETHSLDNEKVFEVADSQDSGMRANLIEQKSRITMVNKAIAMLNPDDCRDNNFVL